MTIFAESPAALSALLDADRAATAVAAQRAATLVPVPEADAVRAVIMAAAEAPGQLLPQVAAARAAEDIQRAAAQVEAEHAGLPASEGEIRAFIRAAYAYRDDLAAEAKTAGQDPAQARRVAVITMQAIVRAMAGEVS